ncbi:histone-like nucleoid-structuring protein Lsr2 [Arthrobacter globiformis]|uniref:histone-like nucleoid-structuring protein Lsr2 n=1 Tax=Arthrobacter globiformis TaxID=1665 RepID=UPI0027D8F2DF|nr:Lsr2 family protein [Arthrobacter globiformis]
MIVLEDDIDGSAAEETVRFAIDGNSYEIDLNSAHAEELRATVSRYASAGRRTAGPAGKTRRPPSGKSRTGKIRAWAEAQGLSVNSRGAINREITAKYDAAH